MKKKELIGGIIVLFLVSITAGYLLAQVYKTTAPRIEEQKKLEKERLNKEIFPEGMRFEEKDGTLPFTAVYDSEGNEIGRICTVKSLGYGGDVVIVVGVTPDQVIRKIKILQHNETPGLGAKVARDEFLKQFENLGLSELYLTKDNPNGKVDAISGATISSRAITDGVRKLLESYKSTGEE